MAFVKEGGRYISPHENLIIWKYLSLDKISTFFTERAFYLTRTDRFEKYLEAVLSISDYQYFENSHFSDIREFVESTKNWTFIDCWSNSNNELKWMWDEYVPKGKGIAIRTTVRKLKRELIDFETEDQVHLS